MRRSRLTSRKRSSPNPKRKSPEMSIRAVVITVSDRGARGERVDGSGPEIAGMLQEAGMEIVGRVIVPDEKADIRRVLIEWSDDKCADLILTTGGTGVSPRD